MPGKKGMKRGRSAERITMGWRKRFGLISDKQIDKQREEMRLAEEKKKEELRLKEQRRKVLIERYGIIKEEKC